MTTKHEEKKIRSLIKEKHSGQFYEKTDLPTVVRSLTINFKETISQDMEHETIITFLSQYLYFSNKEKKYYFNSGRKQKNIKEQNLKLLKTEYENNFDIDTVIASDIIENTNTKRTLDNTNIFIKANEHIESSDSEISYFDTEECESMINESIRKFETPMYVFPMERKYNVIKRTDEKYGPYGTQWVHDRQVDDDINEDQERIAKIYDRLRAIVLPEQRSDEWFAMRRDKITASDGGCVLGLNKYDPQYKFILKKTVGLPFTSNKYCYHGKKLEEIATMIYAYRMNVTIEEFGLMGHYKFDFLGASPDGICNRYKLDGKTKSKYVGRMLEIKCPLTREIKMDGPIKDHICPLYYWIQVQLQLECCDLEECDFWQCDIREYKSRKEFIDDTDDKELFRSKTTGFEKGCLIQLLPKNRYNETITGNYYNVVYEDATFIYPTKIEMSPYECDLWISEKINELSTNQKYYDRVFDKVIYWKLEKSKNVTINRDREWFAEVFPQLRQMWDYVLFFRENNDKLKILLDYIDSMPIKKNKSIMETIENLYKNSNYHHSLANTINENKVIKQEKIDKKIKYKTSFISNDVFMFDDDE